MQRAVLVVQPAAVLVGARHVTLDQPPEAAAVATPAQVRQLVDDDVVEHGRWAQHQPPRERQRAMARGAAPARALVTDGDPADLEALDRLRRDP